MIIRVEVAHGYVSATAHHQDLHATVRSKIETDNNELSAIISVTHNAYWVVKYAEKKNDRFDTRW